MNHRPDFRMARCFEQGRVIEIESLFFVIYDLLYRMILMSAGHVKV